MKKALVVIMAVLVASVFAGTVIATDVDVTGSIAAGELEIHAREWVGTALGSYNSFYGWGSFDATVNFQTDAPGTLDMTVDAESKSSAVLAATWSRDFAVTYKPGRGGAFIGYFAQGDDNVALKAIQGLRPYPQALRMLPKSGKLNGVTAEGTGGTLGYNVSVYHEYRTNYNDPTTVSALSSISVTGAIGVATIDHTHAGWAETGIALNHLQHPYGSSVGVSVTGGAGGTYTRNAYGANYLACELGTFAGGANVISNVTFFTNMFATPWTDAK